jgi:outer membrane receptor for ferrienterochelin and colicin
MLKYPGNNQERKRPLQGQVPYLVNASLNYERPASGTKVAIAYHRSGDQIYALGTNDQAANPLVGYPDIMEKGRDLMDISWSQRVNKFLSLKIGVQNLLNAPVIMYEDFDRDYKYTVESTTGERPDIKYHGDVIRRKYYTRPYYSIGFNFIF